MHWHVVNNEIIGALPLDGQHTVIVNKRDTKLSYEHLFCIILLIDKLNAQILVL